MEIPRLGVKSELQLPVTATATATATPDLSHICDQHHSSQQHRILNPQSKGQGSNPRPYGYLLGLLLLSHDGNSPNCSISKTGPKAPRQQGAEIFGDLEGERDLFIFFIYLFIYFF